MTVNSWTTRGMSRKERLLFYAQPLDNGCWAWTGKCFDRDGYAKVHNHAIRKPEMVHRAMYEELRGPIPEGLAIDHLCRNRGCVNPDHLEPVTNRENTMRSPIAAAAINARRTVCKWGHQFAVRTNKKRYCLTCNQLRRIGKVA